MSVLSAPTLSPLCEPDDPMFAPGLRSIVKKAAMLCNSGRGDDENQEETEEQQEPTPEAGASTDRPECARSVLTSIEQLYMRCVPLPLNPCTVPLL
jgi:hypothetical protein